VELPIVGLSSSVPSGNGFSAGVELEIDAGQTLEVACHVLAAVAGEILVQLRLVGRRGGAGRLRVVGRRGGAGRLRVVGRRGLFVYIPAAEALSASRTAMSRAARSLSGIGTV